MNERNAELFVSHLREEIYRELDKLYAGTKTFPWVVLGPPLPNSILLEKQQRLSGGPSQVEQNIPAKLETHVFLDYGKAVLDVWHKGIAAEHLAGASRVQYSDGTEVERFLVGGDDPVKTGFYANTFDKPLYLDDLARRIIKLIYDAPGSVA